MLVTLEWGRLLALGNPSTEFFAVLKNPHAAFVQVFRHTASRKHHDTVSLCPHQWDFAVPAALGSASAVSSGAGQAFFLITSNLKPHPAIRAHCATFT